MGLPSLEKFLQSNVPNGYIQFGDLHSYHRHGPAWIDNRGRRVITRANTTNRRRTWNYVVLDNPKSTGLYRALDMYTVELALKYGFEGIYVENVMNPFLKPKLLEYGYSVVNENDKITRAFPEVQCFYKSVQ